MGRLRRQVRPGAGRAIVLFALGLVAAATAASPVGSAPSSSLAPAEAETVLVRWGLGSWTPLPANGWRAYFGKRITFQARFILADSDSEPGADTVPLVEAARCTVYYTRGWTRLVRSQVVAARVVPDDRGPGYGSVKCQYVLRKDVASLWMAVNPAIKYGGAWYQLAKDQRGRLTRVQLTPR